MELKRQGTVDTLITELAKKKEAISETARAYPATMEEYMALPLPERMDMAKNITLRYANLQTQGSGAPQGPWRATATFPTEIDSVVIEARIGYSPEHGTSAMNDYFISKYQGISVWLRAIDANNGVSSGFASIGEVEWGGYKEADGTEYGKWVIGTHANVAYADESIARTSYRSVPLESPEAEQLVGIIDTVVGNLIEGDIARERNLGGVAVTNTV